MARNDTNNLGSGIGAVEFFSKDVDYDKQFYESRTLMKENPIKDFRQKKIITFPVMSYKTIINMWVEGGPVRVGRLPDFDAYPLYFSNYKCYEYDQLKELLGNFYTLCEYENSNVRVTFKTEYEVRSAYINLKKDTRFSVKVNLYLDANNNNNENQSYNNPVETLYKPRRNQNLIQQWLDHGDIVCETSKQNCFPLQIDNYKCFKYDKLVELFSKYGKFTSIVHLENGSIQVKFCSEETARDCYKDLTNYPKYNVKLLFFLRVLNNQRKLVKDISVFKEESQINSLILAEENIKFIPASLPPKKKINKLCDGLAREEQNKVKKVVIYYPKNGRDGNIYIEGTPYQNPYLTPPRSYVEASCKKNYDAASLPNDCDFNYQYYLQNSQGRC